MQNTKLGHEQHFFSWLSHENIEIISHNFINPQTALENCSQFFRPRQCRGIVVFAHGTGNDRLFPQLHLFQSLLAAGFAVFTFDLDGHGRHSTSILSESDAASMISRAMKALKRIIPPSDQTLPLHLVGYSLGGNLMLEYLRNPTDEIASCAVIASPWRISLSLFGVMQELKTFVDPVFWQRSRDYGLWNLIPALGPFKRWAYPVRVFGHGRLSPAYIEVTKRIITSFDALTFAPHIKTPVLGIYGERDPIAPTADGLILTSLFPHGKFQVINERTHFTVLLAEETIISLLQWLKAHSPSIS